MRLKSNKNLNKLLLQNLNKKSQPKKRNQEERKICIEFNNILNGYKNLNLICYDVFYWHHSPNGGARNAIEGKNFKMMGVKKGFWDYIFIYGNITDPSYRLLFMEAKKDKSSKLSIDQIEFKKLLDSLNIDNYVFYNAQDAVNFLVDKKILAK